jgi:hypothetical protein
MKHIFEGIFLIISAVYVAAITIAFIGERKISESYKQRAIFWEAQNSKSQVLVDTLLKRNSDLIDLSERVVLKYGYTK